MQSRHSHMLLSIMILLSFIITIPASAQNSPLATNTGYEIRGKVTDAVTGQPVPNVKVDTYTQFETNPIPSDTDYCYSCPRTDSNGEYVLQNISNGDYQIRFWPEGTSYYPVWYGDHFMRSEAQYVTINNASISNINATLRIGAKISGTLAIPYDAPLRRGIRVFDSSGQTVESIFLYELASDPARFITMSLPDGNYRFYYEVVSASDDTAFAPKYSGGKDSLATAEIISIRNAQPAYAGVTFLQVSPKISSNIRGADTNTTLADVRVMYYDQNGHEIASNPTGGNYNNVPLPAGSYRIQYEPLPCGQSANYLPVFYPNSSTLEGATPVTAVTWYSSVDVHLQRGPDRTVYGICGYVNDINGMPIPGITVRTNTGIEGVTDPSGFYFIDGLTPGTSYTVSAISNGYIWSPPVTVSSDKKWASFVGLDDTGERYSISGRVLTPDNQPISAVTIKANGIAVATSGTDGSYQAAGLIPGMYTLSVFKENYVFSTLPPVSVPPSLTEQDFRGLAQEDTYSISGLVVDPNNDPIPGAIISVAGKSALSSVNGSFSITGLITSGSYTITTTYPNGNFNFKDTPIILGTQSITDVKIKGMRRPLIFIPGIMGSYLDKGTCNIWPGLPNTSCSIAPSKTELVDLEANIHATDAIREIWFDTEYIKQPVTRPYADILGKLTTPMKQGGGGYKEYFPSDVQSSTPLARCEEAKAKAKDTTLFVYAYDWRQDIGQSDAKLASLIKCIHEIHGDTEVDIVTHSMGGLVARSYLVSHSTNHYVHNLITIAAPWLGAPKVLPIMETGWYDGSINFLFAPELIRQRNLLAALETLKSIARVIPGGHQLLPSQAYFDLIDSADYPLQEDGRDINGDGLFGQDTGVLSYPQYVRWLNQQYSSHPGKTLDQFHTIQQDNERAYDYGVRYYHIFGNGSLTDTPEVIASRWIPGCAGDATIVNIQFAKCIPFIGYTINWGHGDGTVPKVSAERITAKGNLNAANAQMVAITSGAYQHTPLAGNPQVIIYVLNALNTGRMRPDPSLAQVSPPVITKHVLIQGLTALTIVDAFGHSTDTVSGTLTTPIPDINYVALSAYSQAVALPDTGAYTLTFTMGDLPLHIEMRRDTDSGIDHATRFLDLSLPANTPLQLRITPQGVESLQADTDSNGSFETTIPPTANLSGAAANDLIAPTIQISQSGPLKQMTITLTTADDVSGVKQTLYSLDGTTFQPYTAPFTVDATKSPVLYAFADDKAANRSSLITQQLAYQMSLPLLTR